jgi:hypothetical protein
MDLKDIIEAYRDENGVWHFTNRGVPAGAKVEKRWEPRPGERKAEPPPARKIGSLEEAIDYDTIGEAMRDFTRHKKDLMKHTFGKEIDERRLDERQKKVWRANVNKLFTLLHNQHEQRRAAAIDKFQKGKPASATEQLQAIGQQLMRLQPVLADPNTDNKARAEALQKYRALWQQARFYEELSGKGPTHVTPEQVQTIQDIAAAQWGQMREEERKKFKGGAQAFLQHALREGVRIISGGSMLERAGFKPPAEWAEMSKAGGKGGDPAGALKDFLPAVADVLKGLPEDQRRQLGATIDRELKAARRSGDFSRATALLEQVAAVKAPTPPGATAPAGSKAPAPTPIQTASAGARTGMAAAQPAFAAATNVAQVLAPPGAQAARATPAGVPGAAAPIQPQNISIEQLAAQDPARAHANPVMEAIRWAQQHPEEVRRIAEERRQRMLNSFVRRPPAMTPVQPVAPITPLFQ